MMKLDLAAMGKRIQAQRKAMGMTQQDVYEKIDISQNHYSRIENGHVGMSFEILLQLSQILQISVDYILTGSLINTSCPHFIEKYNQLTDKQRDYIVEQMECLKKYDLK